MTDAGFLSLTPQLAAAHWGWTIAFFLWFIGLSGMLMALFYFVRDKRIALVSFIASILGCVFVLSHLARLTNLPFAAFNALISGSLNFGSWMLIGICLLGVQAVLTLVATAVLYGKVKPDWAPIFTERKAVPVLLAVVGVAVTVYSGFLLTPASGVTFWHTALIPILWVLSGLGCALAVWEFLGFRDKKALPGTARTAGIVIEVSELLALFALLQVAASFSTPGAKAGAMSLISGDWAAMFWIGAVAAGILLPLAIRVFGEKARFAAPLCAVLALAGALCIRASVLFAGYFDPLV